MKLAWNRKIKIILFDSLHIEVKLFQCQKPQLNRILTEQSSNFTIINEKFDNNLVFISNRIEFVIKLL